MALKLRLAIWWKKRKAKHHYQQYWAEQSGIPGGISMACILNPMVNYHATKFNETMDLLAKVDPSTPTARLEVE